MSTTRTRLSPEARREQLLDLGVRLLADRNLEELSIDLLADEAGISRGLLYHYFANKHEFHRAVVERAVSDLVRLTAPPEHGDPLERLVTSLQAYVDYVRDNFAGYTSLVQAAAGGDEVLRELYEGARSQLIDRIFEAAGEDVLSMFGVSDTPEVRLLVRGWSALAEEMVVSWCRAPGTVDRDRLVTLLAGSLPGVLSVP